MTDGIHPLQVGRCRQRPADSDPEAWQFCGRELPCPVHREVQVGLYPPDATDNWNWMIEIVMALEKARVSKAYKLLSENDREILNDTFGELISILLEIRHTNKWDSK